MRLVPSLIVIIILLASCSVKKEDSSNEIGPENTPDSTQVLDKLPDPDWNFSELYGRYQHEASSGTFSSTLVLEPQGLNIAFTLISSKGESCHGEASGNIAMVDHNENFDTGYWVEEQCKLEFIFRRTDDKVDVKEIHICTLHDTMCGFEGTYSRIKSPE